MSQDSYAKFWAALFSITALLTSCSYLIKKDPATPYSKTEYLSVDVNLCGQSYFGTGGCYLPEGSDATSKGFVIQGLYKGEVEVTSDSCNVHKNYRYGENEQIIISFSDLLGTNTLAREHSCTFRFMVSPDYIKGSQETVYPRLGRFFLEVTDAGWNTLPLARGDQQMSSTVEGNPVRIELPVKQDGEWLMTTCEGENVRGKVLAGVATLPPLSRTKTCKYRFGFKLPSARYDYVFYRNVHSRDTRILPDPIVTKSGNKLCVEADESTVSFIAIGDKWANGNKLCATNVPHGTLIRAFTVKRNTLTKAP